MKTGRDLVVVGASAGGVEALREFAADLPPDLPAAVLVVLHLPSSAFSALSAILDRAGPLEAVTAHDGAPLRRGTIYVAPPDQHLLVRPDRIALGRGPKENGHRPAIDPLFRGAARWYAERVVGVVLSGALDDGAAGLHDIVERGGVAVVQDPATASYAGMPLAALKVVPDALQAAGPALSKLIAELTHEQVDVVDVSDVEGVLAMESEIPAMGEHALASADRPGKPAAMTCPDCGGAMFEIDDGSIVRFRCRVGHAWSPESLMLEQVESAEAALWAAIRTLEEKAALHRKLAAREPHSAPGVQQRDYHAERAEEADASAAVLRRMLRTARQTEIADVPGNASAWR